MSSALDLLTEACAGLPMTIRKMFGGHGFFAPNGGMFAGLVTAEEVVLKLADEQARTELLALGGRAWTYDGKGKPMTMREWIVVPDAFYDDHDVFSVWARRAHRLAPAKKKGAPAKGAPAAEKKRAATKPVGSKRGADAAPSARSKRKSAPKRQTARAPSR